jgi:hypothetical protein
MQERTFLICHVKRQKEHEIVSGDLILKIGGVSCIDMCCLDVDTWLLLAIMQKMAQRCA